MKTIYLTGVEIRGLKGGSKTYQFGEKITIFLGSNGTGKTTVLQALHLLLRGRVPRSSGMNPASNGKDILRLSENGRHLYIEGRWSNGITVSREWKLSGGKVAESISQNIDSGTKGAKQQQALLNLYFGNVGEVWDPGQFFSLSPAKMRAKLMTSATSRPLSAVMDMMPREMPRWLAPGSTDMPAETWLESAIKALDDKIRSVQAENREHKRKIEDGIEFVAHKSEAQLKQVMDDLIKERVAIEKDDSHSKQISYLEGRQQALQEELDKIEIALEIAVAEQKENQTKDHRSIDVVQQEYMKAVEEYKIIGAQEELQQQLEDAKECLKNGQSLEKSYKNLRENFKKTEQKLLASAKKPFEEAISRAVGKPCIISLKEGGCIIRVGGVDVSGLSDGESLRFIPGVVAALAANSESKWVPLPLDRFEAVSANEREAFLKTIDELIEEGCLSQAFLAGCPDGEIGALPDKEKVRIYDFDKARQ